MTRAAFRCRPWLVFAGTTVRVIEASDEPAAHEQVRVVFADRGVTIGTDEYRLRAATVSDLGWLEDAGAGDLASRIRVWLDGQGIDA